MRSGKLPPPLFIGISTILWLMPALVHAYGYPVQNPLVATIAGTPPPYKAALPTKIPVKKKELKVFRERKVPSIFWYQKALKYSLAPQEKKAPLMFVIAAAGSGHNAPTMQVLQRAFYQDGYHVVSLSSPTHPNFMVTASSTGVPGNVGDDAADLYRVMQLVMADIEREVEVSGFFLTGYSLGATDAAFVARLDEERKVFNFKKVLMIDPTVNLHSSITIIDDMLTRNVPGGLDNLDPFIDKVMDKMAGYYRGMDVLDFNNDVLYQVFEEQGTNDKEIAALIGLSFRLVSSNMLFTADVLNNTGYLVPMDSDLGSTDSTTPYLKTAFHIGFTQFFEEYFVPFFTGRTGTSKEVLKARGDMKSIETYLRQAAKIGVMANEDDLLLTSGDLDFIRRVFGSRATIYPRGGHLGNIEYKENIADMLKFFRQ